MKRDHLDDAIDHVATLLVRVEDNDGLSTRILASLPDRSPWAPHWWMPRLAITAALGIGVALGVLRTFDDGSTGVLRTENASAPVVEFHAAVERTPAELELIVRRTIVERPQNDRRTTADHERSLVAIAPPAVLSLKSVSPSELPGQGALAVEPLAIADLPLTAEAISPR